VSVREFLDSVTDLFVDVRNAPGNHGLVSARPDQVGEHLRIPVGLHPLVNLGAGRQDGDLEPVTYSHSFALHIAQECCVSPRESVSGLEHAFAASDFAPARGDVRSRVERVGRRVHQSILRHGRVFPFQDRSRVVRKRCPGRNRDRHSGSSVRRLVFRIHRFRGDG
jgi:hypothetical protein